MPLAPYRTAPRRGFTLIELLTVIAIIGILAAIIIPVTGKVRTTARAASCASNLRQIGGAIMLYAQENKNFIPAALGTGGATPTLTQNPSGLQWTAELNRYIERDVTDLNRVSKFFACPQYQSDFPQGTTAYRQGYGYNVILRQSGSNSVSERTRLNLTRIPNPSRTVFVGDSSRETLRPNATDGTFAANTATTTYGAYYEGAPERHGGSRANYLFADGSVRGLPYEDAQLVLRRTP